MTEMGDMAELPGSDRRSVAGATRIGDADPGEMALVTIIVRRRAGEGFSPDWASASQGDPARWRREQRARFAETDGADQADIDRVAGWARDSGLQVSVSDRVRRTVTVEGSVAQLGRAFEVSLGRYQAGDLVYRGREGRVRIPGALAGIVEAVLGLDDRPQARPHHLIGSPIAEADLPAPNVEAVALLHDRLVSSAGNAPSPQPLWTAQVARAYNFPAGAGV